MLKIRLQRKGRKRMPVFKIVVAEHSMPVQGRFIEKLGSFIGGKKKETLILNKERVAHWISVGAQPSETVAQLLVNQGITEAKKFVKQRKQVPSKAELKAKEEAEAAKQAAEEAEAAKESEAENSEEETTEEATTENTEEKKEEAE